MILILSSLFSPTDSSSACGFSSSSVLGYITDSIRPKEVQIYSVVVQISSTIYLTLVLFDVAAVGAVFATLGPSAGGLFNLMLPDATLADDKNEITSKIMKG